MEFDPQAWSQFERVMLKRRAYDIRFIFAFKGSRLSMWSCTIYIAYIAQVYRYKLFIFCIMIHPGRSVRFGRILQHVRVEPSATILR
jgi:hypothetical protein